MSISCFKNCKVGDVLHITGSGKYLATHNYIDQARNPGSEVGYIPLLNLVTKQDTYITFSNARYLTKIIKTVK